MEEDNPFQNTFGDDIIEEQKIKKASPIPIVNYSPKIDTELWFKTSISTNTTVDSEDRHQKKFKVKRIQYLVDHLFITGQYEQCLTELETLKKVMVFKKKDYSENLMEMEMKSNFKLKRYQQTIDIVDRLITLKKNITNAPLILLKAQSHHLLGQISEATRYYQQTLSINRKIWDWWFNLSLTFLQSSLVMLNHRDFCRSYLSNNNTSVHNDILSKLDNISLKDRILAKLSLERSSYIISQTIIAKRVHATLASFNLLLEQLHLIKSFSDTILKELDMNLSNAPVDQYKSDETTRSHFNEFELKWIIDFKLEALELEFEIEKRDENPLSL
ncbi:hypothetical protein DLAC_05648 [Tieghemostelium lacteum]|uniref:Uncharacterized protein n=1 Tax=Tieghemostelium lacteum TaxID=361077 RepID=A0A151ZGK1_TIELA|nr:hypothetical protein DLAC_05648 [Tieghemostelium lacteum]|eukprot:KYQ93039.1 hypothetical protein DLAC_05648 [Tieghemostelium lacteum]